MPFNRPGLKTLIDRIAADIEAGNTGAFARIRRKLLTILGRAMAGAVHGLYGYLEIMTKQMTPYGATGKWLERWASIWKIIRKAATQATGSVDFTGVDGSVVPADTVLQRSDGMEFKLDAEAVIAAGVATAAVTAVNADSDDLSGNSDNGTTLTLVNPIAGINAEATVDADGLTGGFTIENDDSLRERLLYRIQHPPAGGAAHDYVIWGREVAGVTRVWTFPLWLGVNSVGVSFVTDDAAGGLIPDAAMVQTVQDYIDELRPVTAVPTVFAPLAVPLDLSIQLTPDTAAVRVAVQAEIDDLLRRVAQVEDGNGSGKVLISHIREAISLAAGETDHALTVPAGDVNLTAGQISVPGVTTWL